MKNTHLSLNDRITIQVGIENNSKFIDISKNIGKDPTTISKEIKLHREIHQRNLEKYPICCKNSKNCKFCTDICEKFEEIKCSRRDKSPGACNGCKKIHSCSLDHYFYYAEKAHREYTETLIKSREGINITPNERKQIADIIVPLIKQGQSIYQILSAHPEIKQCEKTIYNYIDLGVFNDFGIQNISLKEKVKRKIFKDKYKRRKTKTCYEGKKYDDYLIFKEKHPGKLTTEMDTVMNSTSGPYIQTFIFEKTQFMIGILHKNKTSISMSSTIDYYQKNLNENLFSKLFGLLLTDRGSEFEKSELFSFNQETGEKRLDIFYCDRMASYQKPHVENNHNYVRDIIVNELPLNNITQDDLNLVFSHINSTPRESLNGKTPYEIFEFLYGVEPIKLFNIQKVERDDVILKPYLLKHLFKK